MVDPIQVTFRSKIVGGKFYTLDGEKEVTAPWYAKFITGADMLTEPEIEYIITSYARMERDLGGIILQLQTIKGQ